jgi:hypothetical protein
MTDKGDDESLGGAGSGEGAARERAEGEEKIIDIEKEKARRGRKRAGVRREARKALDGPDDEWRAYTHEDDEDALPANHSNVVARLAYSPAMEGVFGYNQFSLDPVMLKPLPPIAGVIPEDKNGTFPRPVEDIDITHLIMWAHQNGLTEPGERVMQSAMLEVAKRKPFHPIRDWLRSLRWKGVKRLDTWLASAPGPTRVRSKPFCRGCATRMRRTARKRSRRLEQSSRSITASSEESLF